MREKEALGGVASTTSAILRHYANYASNLPKNSGEYGKRTPRGTTEKGPLAVRSFSTLTSIWSPRREGHS
jgi:hypothetical protein